MYSFLLEAESMKNSHEPANFRPAAQYLNQLRNGVLHIRGGADKSLARPGRKQATATKLGIYSTYSPYVALKPTEFLSGY
jgi:hypothetical protein